MFNWRLLLFPFALIYGVIMYCRNLFYDFGIFRTHKIRSKSIVVGNLSVGGTGKSPHILYLTELLNKSLPLAILSRGYGRSTKGLLEVSVNSNSNDVGDEPLMFKKRLNQNAMVVVAEERKKGVVFIEQKQQGIILLDDAFQHRKVTAGFNMLLTDYSFPFYHDFMLPAGNLRELKIGKKRAHCIVVTKCPDKLPSEEKESIINNLNVKRIPVFFSKMVYGELISFGKPLSDLNNIQKAILVTGIAKPQPLLKRLNRFYEVELLAFPDHYNFSREDCAEIHRKFDTFAHENCAIITTEKDFVRLDSLLTSEEKTKYPWYYQSITVKIDEEEKFKDLINSYVDTI